MMTDAELLLGAWRHLSAFTVNPATAQIEGIAVGGKIYELAWRLRGSGVSSAARVAAIAVEAGIGRAEVDRVILPVLEQLGWVTSQRTPEGQLLSVSETVPATAQLLQLASGVLAIVATTPTEVAALELLRGSTLQPLERDALIAQAVTACGDERSAEDALGVLESVRLVRVVRAEDGRSAVFNPNIWVDDAAVTQAALRCEDAQVSAQVGALLEEISAAQGIPEESITSTDQRWIDFAVAQGLVQRSVVQTQDQHEKRFLFTPHLRDPFGTSQLDPSGHVRQLVGSMVYASTFATHRLYSPAAFIRKLINEGEAGNASDIGTDYPMLETAGIVRVVDGFGRDRYRLQLLQSDVAEGALQILREREQGPVGAGIVGGDLLGQRGYVHVDKERARLAETAATSRADQERLVAALRETTARRGF